METRLEGMRMEMKSVWMGGDGLNFCARTSL